MCRHGWYFDRRELMEIGISSSYGYLSGWVNRNNLTKAKPPATKAAPQAPLQPPLAPKRVTAGASQAGTGQASEVAIGRTGARSLCRYL